MTRALTTGEVYPLDNDPEFEETARALLNGAERNIVGRTILGRAMTKPERAIVQRRQSALNPALVHARASEIKLVVEQMLAGMGMAMMEMAEAQVLVAQFCVTLSDLPLFAIAQACLRFARGQVRAEELDLKKFPRGYRPTTDQVHAIAEAIAAPRRNEFYVCRALLNAEIALPMPTPEQRANGAATLEKVGAMLAAKSAELDAADMGQRGKALNQIDEMARKSLIREYTSRGLDPVYAAPGVPTSLSMLLSQGWEIKQIGQENVLVRPGGR